MALRLDSSPLGEEVDDLLEGRLFVLWIERPPVTVVAFVGDAEQVFEPVVEGERIALDIEEEVARRRRGQGGQAATRHDRSVWQLLNGPAARRRAAARPRLDLNLAPGRGRARGLLGVPLAQPRLERQVQPGQRAPGP